MPISWPAALDREVRRIAGPEDDFDDEANGNPDSMTGEDDEAGFEEMADYPDETGLDDGFEDTEVEDEADDETEEEDDE